MYIGKRFKRWKILAAPNMKIYFWQFVTEIIPAVVEIIMAIYLAKLLDSISVFDYSKSKTYIIYLLLFLLIILIFNNINYVLFSFQTKIISKNIYKGIFTKLFSVKSSSFKANSKEKIISIISNNADIITKFTSLSCKKVAALIALIIITSYIFYYSYIIGLISVGIVFLSCVLNIVSSLILSRQLNKTQLSKDGLYECVGGVIDGVETFNDYNIVDSIRNKYNSSVEELIKNNRKESFIKMAYDRWVLFVAKALIYITLFYLIVLLEDCSISYATFLVLVPYLSSSVINTLNFISLFQDMSETNIASLRINTIFEMSKKDIVAFGNNTTGKIDGSIVFSNVSFLPTPSQQEIYGKLEKTSFSIQKNTIITITGPKNCGKKALFHLLKRDLRPTTGTITFDSINIYDFDNKTYIGNFSQLLATPHFFNDSIINNLKYVSKNTRAIYRTLKFVGALSKIKELPDSFQTTINSTNNLSPFLLFLIGLARCLLTGSEIIAIYELPHNLSNDELTIIKRVIKNISHNHTILYFAAEPKLNQISNKIISLNNGKMSIKTN